MRGEKGMMMNVQLESLWPSNAANSSRDSRPWSKWSSYEIKVLKKCAGVLSASEIAQIIGRSVGGVEGKAQGMGISLMLWGEKHHRAKHPDSAVEFARKLYENGWSVRKISAKYKWPLPTVQAWCYFKQRTGIQLGS